MSSPRREHYTVFLEPVSGSAAEQAWGDHWAAVLAQQDAANEWIRAIGGISAVARGRHLLGGAWADNARPPKGWSKRYIEQGGAPSGQTFYRPSDSRAGREADEILQSFQAPSAYNLFKSEGLCAEPHQLIGSYMCEAQLITVCHPVRRYIITIPVVEGKSYDIPDGYREMTEREARAIFDTHNEMAKAKKEAANV